MPGSIHVRVLEAVDLPAELKESPELVAVKVSLGSQEFTTGYRRFETKSTGTWNSDFAFPVLNLQDKLAVALCDPEGKILTKCEIEVPSILQQGYREEYVELSKGGRLHLQLTFVLTAEERKKVKEMRAAAQRKKEKEQKDDMMVRRSNKLTKSIERAYDFKRKEDYCTDNGLRTIAEKKAEHAGKRLDNWEVFNRKKDKEVSPVSLFELPQPPPLKPSQLVETGKPVEISADRERCSKNKYTTPCSIVEGVLCHSSLNQDNIMDGAVRTSSPEPIGPACTAEIPETPPSSEGEVDVGPSKGPVAENTQAAPCVLSGTDEQKENRPASFTSVDSTSSVEPHDDHVSCHEPEVEECMELRLLETRQEVKKEVPSNQGFSRQREENPFYPKGLPTNGLVEQDTDTESILKETEVTTLQVLDPKENVTTSQESSSLVQGVVAAVRMSTFSEWDSGRKLTRVKGADRGSPKLSPHAHVVKDFLSEVETRSGEQVKTVSSTLEAGSPKLGVGENGEKVGTLPLSSEVENPTLELVGLGIKVIRVSSSPDVGNPKLRERGIEMNGGLLPSSVDMDRLVVGSSGADEKSRLLSSALNVGSPKVGLYHLECRQTGSPRLPRGALNSFEADCTSITKATLSSYEAGSPRLSQTFARVEKNSGLLSRLLSDDSTSTVKQSSVLTSATHGPMDGWVCVERPPMTWEDALRVAQKAREAALAAKQHPAAPFTLPSPVKLPPYNFAGAPSPVAPTEVVKGPTSFVCAPLPPPPPKSSPRKASINTGHVMAHAETYESGSSLSLQLDLSSGKVGNSVTQIETSSPTGVQMAPRGRRSAEEELIKWEERLKNWGQADLKVIQEEPRHRNHNKEKQLSWDMDDFEDSIRKDFEARLQSPSSDCESTSSRLAVPAAEVRWDVENATRSSWLGEEMEAPTRNEGCLDLFEDLHVEDMEESLMEEVSKNSKKVSMRVRDIVLRDKERGKLEDPINSAQEVLDEQRGSKFVEKVMEVAALHIGAEKDYIIKSENDVSNILKDPVAIGACDKVRGLPEPQKLSKLNSSSKLVPSAFAIQQLPFSGDSKWSPKCRKKPKAKARQPYLVSDSSQTDDNAPKPLAKAMTDQSEEAKKADLIIESLCKSLEPASDFLLPLEQTADGIQKDSEPFTEEEKQKNSLVGGALKQVLGGAVLAAGVFVLWPKNAGNTERYHVVQTGETLSNILSEQAIDPSSRFCKLNPHVCERKTVYPGQRLRLA